MANSSRSRAILSVNLDSVMANDPLRELFEACKTGEIAKVKKLITPQTVNARDTAGRKSTPLHFAAGKCPQDASGCTKMRPRTYQMESGTSGISPTSN